MQAQDELLGEHGNYFMIAYGTLGVKSAFKMLCRAKNIDIDTSNEISKLISAYEKDKKHNDSVKIEDYITNPRHLELINDSKVYRGIIDSYSVSPCSFILFNGDIRREFGLIRDKNDVLMACVTGNEAEKWGYLKNDLLLVKVVGLNDALYKRIGIEQPCLQEFRKWIENDKELWDLYANGYTQWLNQVEQNATAEKVMRYKPKSLIELALFVASVRPAFANDYKTFENRLSFSYGIKEFDKVIKGEYLQDSFIIFQEQIMVILQWLGFPDNETYTIMKKGISKKNIEIMGEAKEKFEEMLMEEMIKDILIKEDIK